MKTVVYILPLFLCCLPVWGQQQPAASAIQTNANPRHGSGLTFQEILAKCKENETWVKLDAALRKQTMICTNLESQIKAESEVLHAKAAANPNASVDRTRFNDLRRRYGTALQEKKEMVKEWNAIVNEVKEREANKK